MATRRFPEGFVWGTATSAHQVEGGNWNNDWWMWEHDPASPCQEPSGDACDHWHRWPEDVRLLAELGFNAYRFSLEWSRIEPEDGEFSRAALDHYRRVCAACREHGVEPIVTFHHFTTPRWLAARGGWANPETADRFARFAARAAAHLGDVMGRACTLNEPNIVATFGYLHGLFPPGRRDPDLRRRVNEVLIDAHRKATAAIRSGPGRPAVGLVLAMSDCQAVPGGEAERDRYRRCRAAKPSATATGATWKTSTSRPRPGTTSSACSATRARASAPRACSGPSAACARRRWATSSGPRRWRRPSAVPGR